MVPIFVINLDRASDRWSSVVAAAEIAGAQLNRVAGIDGRALPGGTDPILDAAGFARRCGRPALPGEVGCYLSHRKALEAFLETGADHGVIMEDDVLVSQNGLRRLQLIVDAAGDADIIKLVNHRCRGFVGASPASAEGKTGRALFGPQGSAAAYCVSRAGAARFLAAASDMVLPYDVELERGWAHGTDVRSVMDNVFAFSEHRSGSAIATRADYQSKKHPWHLRIPTAFFRSGDHIRRFAYAAIFAIKLMATRQ